MFIIASKYDGFNHRVGDTDSLEDLMFGLSGDKDDAARIAKIADMMTNGDVLATGGFAIFRREAE